ncbi:MAG: Asp-tRNA(Asn)/Glu-tRNA(Gln) amidotransferase subunit GatC [Candidatus Omnitrophota bacterium]|jgi:aspartyl-tRNA(Asn)/glutamyl-tRNA(Gln) amidotransferase subunit C
MKEAISKEDVKHVALLSRLRLNEEEVAKFQKQLSSILEYIAQLDEVDTKDTLPTSHVLSSMKNVFRKDELKKSISPEEALSNAPARHEDFFEVPKIIKDA